MAQALAEPGDIRHGFRQFGTINHDFDRITSMSVTKNGNVLLCDYNKKQIDLVDADGSFLNKLPLPENPYDVAVTTSNVAFVTLPNDGYILQLDPDRLFINKRLRSNDYTPGQMRLKDNIKNESVKCVSAIKLDKGECAFSISSTIYLYDESNKQFSRRGGRTCEIYPPVVKFHARKTNYENRLYNVYYCCVGSEKQNSILASIYGSRINTPVDIQTLKLPSDICSDDNDHIYVSGMYSHNIHRLTEKITRKYDREYDAETIWDGKILDIPLSSKQGIHYPVAMCFNQDYTKFYVANDWGKSVIIFDVL